METLKTLSFSVQDLLKAPEGETAEWALDLEVAELVPDLRVKSKLKGSLQAFRMTEGFLLTIPAARVQIEENCVRCAEPTKLNLKIEDSSREFLEHWNEEEVESFPIDLERLTVDLSEFIRQEIYLAVPQLIYCKASCKGVCSQCGRNLNKGHCDCEKKAKMEKQPFQKLKDMLKEQ